MYKIYKIIIFGLLVLFTSCKTVKTTVKTIKFCDAEDNDLPRKILDINYGYSLNLYLNTNIIINPKKKIISKSNFPNKIILNKLRYLILNDVNVLVGIEVINNKRINAIKRFYKSKQIQTIDSISMYSYSLSNNFFQYDVIDYLSKIGNNDFLKISFVSYHNQDLKTYFNLSNYAVKVIKSLQLNYITNEFEKIKKNCYGYMFDSYNYRGNYFQSLFLLDSLMANGKNNELMDPYILYNSFCGKYSPYLKSIEKNIKNKPLYKLNYVDAKQYIGDIAGNYDILLFNENHNDPYCRFFLKNLLPVLKSAGFTQIGIETLSYINHDINTFGYPIHGSGFYSDEPQMANLIRNAYELGFKIFPYEACSWKCKNCKTRSEKQQYRETMQAENILTELKKSSNPKCIILAGFDHIDKQNNISDLRMMAQELLNKSKYKILSINQTNQQNYYIPDTLPYMDCIPIMQNGKCFLYKRLQGIVDLQILHNGPFHYSSDFNFNQIIGSDTIVNIPLHYLNKNKGYLTILSKKENLEFIIKDIPYTNIYIEKGIPEIKIKLDKGKNYIFCEYNKYGYPIYSSIYKF